MRQDGGTHPKLVEHPVVVKRSHSVQWKREEYSLDQKKLATLRALHGWTIEKMAKHYCVSRTTIKTCLYGLDRSGKKKGVRNG
jgi:hypothetical protein